MKNLAFAVFLQIAILTISVAAQMKPNVPSPATAITAGTPKIPVTSSRVSGRSKSDEGSNTADKSVDAQPAVSKSPFASLASSLTQVYRVGVADVLDIQLPQNPTTKSTLFTVLSGGVIDYPLAGEPVSVAGLTTKEIAEQLRQRIKVLDQPTVNVNVREYASHSVTVVGFVNAPGIKILRREAVPLFVLLAEASPLEDATKATIVRNGQGSIMVNLKESAGTSTLIVPGDVIKIRPD